MEWECRDQVLARQDTNSKSKGRIFRTCSCVRSPCCTSAFMREVLAPEGDDHTLFACPLAEGSKQSGTYLLPFCYQADEFLYQALADDCYGSTKSRTGRCNDIRTSASTSSVMVAEKSIVWRAVTHPSSSSANPSENILSASSRTRASNVSNPNEGKFRKWSMRRPGVAIMMTGRVHSSAS